MSDALSHWWTKFDHATKYVDPMNWFALLAFSDAVSSGVATHMSRLDGRKRVHEDEFAAALAKIGFREVLRDDVHGHLSVYYAGARGVVCETSRGVTFVTAYPDDREALARVLADCFASAPPEAGRVSVLVRDEEGLHVREIGANGVALERANYDDAVLRAHDHVVEDLRSVTPCGRLVVISGPTGCGKSYLVRDMLRAVPEATFVLVPPQMLASLGGPDVLPAIQHARDARSDERHGPVVLVCEDGDHCLVPRMADNMSDVQAILNLSDGILSAVLDVRVIVTTNAVKLDMDRAVVREERLCRHVEVGRLTPSHADCVLRRLLGEPPVNPGWYCGSESLSLAQVYRRAREQGWRPVAPEAASVGDDR